MFKKRLIGIPKKRSINRPQVIVDGLEKGAKPRMHLHPCAAAILDLKCCGCNQTTGKVAWHIAHSHGWRKFYMSSNTNVICPKCREEE